MPLTVVTDSATSLQLALLPTQRPVVLAARRLPERTAKADAALALLTGAGTRPFTSQETEIGTAWSTCLEHPLCSLAQLAAVWTGSLSRKRCITSSQSAQAAC